MTRAGIGGGKKIQRGGGGKREVIAPVAHGHVQRPRHDDVRLELAGIAVGGRQRDRQLHVCLRQPLLVLVVIEPRERESNIGVVRLELLCGGQVVVGAGEVALPHQHGRPSNECLDISRRACERVIVGVDRGLIFLRPPGQPSEPDEVVAVFRLALRQLCVQRGRLAKALCRHGVACRLLQIVGPDVRRAHNNDGQHAEKAARDHAEGLRRRRFTRAISSTGLKGLTT